MEFLGDQLLRVENAAIALLYLVVFRWFAPTPSDGTNAGSRQGCSLRHDGCSHGVRIEEEKKRAQRGSNCSTRSRCWPPSVATSFCCFTKSEASHGSSPPIRPMAGVLSPWPDDRKSSAQEEALTYELYFGDTLISHDTGSAAEPWKRPKKNYFRRCGPECPLGERERQESWHPEFLVSFQPERAVEAEQPSTQSA